MFEVPDKFDTRITSFHTDESNDEIDVIICAK